jgi:hypothetical protein
MLMRACPDVIAVAFVVVAAAAIQSRQFSDVSSAFLLCLCLELDTLVRRMLHSYHPGL